MHLPGKNLPFYILRINLDQANRLMKLNEVILKNN